MSEILIPSSPPSSHYGRASLVLFSAILLLFLCLALWMIQSYLLILFLGGILAVLSRPAYLWLVEHRWKEWAAALLVISAIFVLVLGPLLALSIVAVRQGLELGKHLMEEPPFHFQSLLDRVFAWKSTSLIFGDRASFEAQINQGLEHAGKLGSQAALAIVANVPESLLNLIVVLVACYFFLIDGVRFQTWLQNKVPLHPEVRVHIRRSFQDTAVSTIWSAMAGAIAQAGFLIVGFLILGVPAVFLAGGAAFILAWIPIVGSIPVWLAGFAYIYLKAGTGKLLILCAFAAAAAIADNVIRPLVLRGRGNMHSMVGLVAIFGGIEMFGIFGVLYGPILVAVALSLLEVWPSVGRRYGITFDNGSDLEVFPADVKL